jgi:hypothetical protein
MAKETTQMDINGIIAYYRRVIKTLYTQKARNDKIIDKYQGLVKEEAEKPANRFMHWTTYIGPYVDAEISGKVTDYDIIKLYEEYAKTLVTAIVNMSSNNDDPEDVRENLDVSINKLLRLEKKYDNLKSTAVDNLKRLRIKAIEYYQKLPHSQRFDDDYHCILCGEELEKAERAEKICFDCKSVPMEHKAKYLPSDIISEEEPEEEYYEDEDPEQTEDSEPSEEPKEDMVITGTEPGYEPRRLKPGPSSITNKELKVYAKALKIKSRGTTPDEEKLEREQEAQGGQIQGSEP